MDIALTISKANKLRKFIEDPDIKEVFSDLRGYLFNIWMNTNPTQHEQREKLYYEIHGLIMIEKGLKKLVDKGTQAELEQNYVRSKNNTAGRIV